MFARHSQRPLLRLALALLAFTVAVCMPMRWEKEAHSGCSVQAGIDSGGLYFADDHRQIWSQPSRMGCPRITVEYVHQTYYNRQTLPTRRFTLEALYARGVSMSEAHPEHGALVDMAVDRLRDSGVLTAADVGRLTRTPLINRSSIHWPGWCRLLLLPVAVAVGLVIMPWRWLVVDVPRALAASIGAEPDRTTCASCNYPLVGLPTRTCPECGHHNEPASGDV